MSNHIPSEHSSVSSYMSHSKALMHWNGTNHMSRSKALKHWNETSHILALLQLYRLGGFVGFLIVTYLAWNTNSISALDQTLSQVTNDLRGDTNNISALDETLSQGTNDLRGDTNNISVQRGDSM